MTDNKINVVLTAKNELSGALSVAGRELQDFASKADAIGSRFESAGLRIGAMGLAANAGLSKLGLDLGSVASASISAEKALFGIASTAGINGAAAETIVSKWSLALNQIAADSNQTTSEIITAFSDLVAKGIDEKDAIKMLAPIGKAATATGADIRDIAVAAGAGFSKLNIDADRLTKALDMMAKAGDLGAFELKDMAGYFDMLTAKSASLGAVGEGALAQLAAAAQIARRGTGDAASAATNLANWLDKLHARSTDEAFFKRFGVDLEKVKKEARESGDFIGYMVAKIRDITGGDATKISRLFPDVQAGSFIKQAVADLDLYKKMADEATQATGVVGEKLDTQMRSSAEKLKAVEINLSGAIGASSVINTLLGSLESLADWAAKHPDIAGLIGVGVATTAAIGLVGGAVVAGIGATITAVGSLSGALTGLSTLLLANPVVAVLLGVGAATYVYWDEIVAAVEKFWTKTKSLFLDGGEFLKQSFLNFTPVVWIAQSFNAVSEYFSSVGQAWKTAGANLIGSLRAGIADRLSGALGIGEKFAQAISYLKGESARWMQIGRDLMQGLLDGIYARYTEIIDRLKSLGSDMVKTVKNVLGIRSPSRVFQEIGEQTGEGLQIGLLSKKEVIVSAAKRLADAAIDASFDIATAGQLKDRLNSEIDLIAALSGEMTQLLEDGTKATRDLRAEQEKSAETLKNYNSLLGMNVDGLEKYDQTIAATSKSAVASLNNINSAIRDSKGRFLPSDEIQRSVAEWERASQDITRSLTDALMRGFESGKGFAQNLRDTLKNLFGTLVLRPIIQPIAQAGSNFLMGLLGLGGSATSMAAGLGGGSGGSGIGDALSLASSLKDAWKYASNYFSGSSVAAAAPNYYAVSPLGSTPPGGAAGTAVGNPALATAAQYLGAAAAGFVIGKMISGGYSALGKSGNAAVMIGTAVGAFGGPIGMIIGGAIGGVVNRLFGRKLKEVGIQGTFSGEGFSGEQYRYEKGGILRSNKTTTSPLDAALDESMDKSYQSLRLSAMTLGNVFMDTSKSLDNFSYSIKLNFLGLDAEASNKLIEGELTKMGDAMASVILADIARAEMATAGIATDLASDVEQYWKDFARAGESSTETLTRLSGSLAGVNGWMDRLGMTMLDTTLAAGDMASELVDLFGSMDKFSQSMQSYTERYYTSAERLQMGTADLQQQFDNLGLAMPGTIEEFRALVEAQDLTTESGRNTYASLIGLNEAFYGVAQAGNFAALNGRTLMAAWTAQTSIVDGLISSYDGSTAAQQTLADAARSRYQIELALVKQIETALSSTHEMFLSTIEEMKFSTLDTAGKYDFLQAKSSKLEDLLRASTDPAEIKSLAEQLNQVSRDAWMLLSEDEKRIKIDAYEKYLNELDTLTAAQLAKVKQNIEDAEGGQDNVKEAIAAAISSALAAHTGKLMEAALIMLAAADKPVKIDNRVTVDVDVNMPASVEVGIL